MITLAASQTGKQRFDCFGQVSKPRLVRVQVDDIARFPNDDA